MSSHNIERLPYPIGFPIAMDKKVASQENIGTEIEHICDLNPNFEMWTKEDKDELRTKVGAHLKSLEFVSLTFTLNQL